MMIRKYKPIIIKTSIGTYKITCEFLFSKTPNSSIYEEENISGWISNFWWENFEEEKEQDKNTIPSKDKNCWHDWKEYIGFTEKYWYCEKCDVKSKENPNLSGQF